MNSNQFSKIGLVVAMVGFLAISQPAFGQNRLPFNTQRNAPRVVNLKITKDAGPWLIFCGSFATQDENGFKQAKDLAIELRRLGFKSYLYEKKFDYSEIEKMGLGVQGDEVSENVFANSKKKMKLKNTRNYTDISVLVGDFPSKDDPTALRRLNQIKKLHPQSLNYNGTRMRMAPVRHFYQMVNERVAQTAKSQNPKAGLGPMRAAFLAPNPLLPESAYKAVADQSFLIKLNSKTRYSLLNCKKKYTVKVATFKGKSFINDNKIRNEQIAFNEILSGRRKAKTEGSSLDKAFIDAENLVIQLRKAKLEAYVYHDRGSSIVCVGSYDWVTKGNAKNSPLNPNIQTVINYFKAKEVVSNIPGVPSYYKPKQFVSQEYDGKKMKPVLRNFDLVPVAVEVPQLGVRR